MNVKEYLMQVHGLNLKIKNDLEECENLRSMITCVKSPDLSGLPSGGHSGKSPFSGVIEKLIDREMIINEEIDRYIALKDEIREQISLMPDVTYKTILKGKYLVGLTWQQIAEDMNYTPQWVQTLNHRALDQFAEMYHFETVDCSL